MTHVIIELECTCFTTGKANSECEFHRAETFRSQRMDELSRRISEFKDQLKQVEQEWERLFMVEHRKVGKVNQVDQPANPLIAPSNPSLSTPEPDPDPNLHPYTWDLVIKDMQERHESGMKKYKGVGLQPCNGRDNLVDAYQEVLDLAVYLRTEIEERRIKAEKYKHDVDELAERVDRKIEYLSEGASPSDESCIALFQELIATIRDRPTWQLVAVIDGKMR